MWIEALKMMTANGKHCVHINIKSMFSIKITTISGNLTSKYLLHKVIWRIDNGIYRCCQWLIHAFYLFSFFFSSAWSVFDSCTYFTVSLSGNVPINTLCCAKKFAKCSIVNGMQCIETQSTFWRVNTAKMLKCSSLKSVSMFLWAG